MILAHSGKEEQGDVPGGPHETHAEADEEGGLSFAVDKPVFPPTKFLQAASDDHGQKQGHNHLQRLNLQIRGGLCVKYKHRTAGKQCHQHGGNNWNQVIPCLGFEFEVPFIPCAALCLAKEQGKHKRHDRWRARPPAYRARLTAHWPWPGYRKVPVHPSTPRISGM
jgi:hypothetical protein